MPFAGLRELLVKSRVTRAVAVAQRRPRITREAVNVARAPERARHTRAGWSRGPATWARPAPQPHDHPITAPDTPAGEGIENATPQARQVQLDPVHRDAVFSSAATVVESRD